MRQHHGSKQTVLEYSAHEEYADRSSINIHNLRRFHSGHIGGATCIGDSANLVLDNIVVAACMAEQLCAIGIQLHCKHAERS
jgi:hypothetical protein